LHIARRLAEAFRAYERFSETIDLLEAALRDHQAAQGGTLPMSANDALDQLISCLEHRGHYARGEKILQEQLSHPANQQQVYWLTERLTELYVKTACYRGTVSLGTGKDLYRVVNRRIQGELDTPDDKHRQTLIGLLFELYHGVREEQPGMVDDLRALAFTRVPEVLKRQRNGYEAIVGNVAQTLFILAGPRDALAFLIERIEQEPTWLRLSNRGGWSQHGHQLAQNFHDVKDLGGLEERLLAIVTAELRRDLESRQRRHSDLYCRDGFAYWAEKADVFARTAEQVLARHKDSGATVIYIANYFYDGLDRPGRAIEILLDAHRRGVLDEKGQHRLAEVLHRRERFADSIPILEPLVRRWPENVRYRTMLMHAFYRTRQPNRLLALLKETDASFHKDDRWQESVIAALASSCLENHLYEQSVVYYQEAIPLHQRTAPRRGIGDGTLASYHADQARAYAGLGKTPEAVDAACAAIVSWGPRHDQRTQALASLQQVLHQSRDLEAYVAWLDKEAARTGLGNPIVRKALGQAYAEKGQYSKAIFQFRLAAELQPNDAETYRKLVECCDKLGDKEGAVRELLRGAELSRRDVQLFAQLADRLKALGRPDEAERACTSMVEILPGESEGHALLAEIRQRENRWADAIAEWEQVARIRPLEPTGLLKLAEAQIHQRRWDDAWKTVQRLKARAWPPRFQGVDSQIGELERQVRERRDEHTKDEP
jgi:tetratricopeptide (TPR) repeat protein